MKYLICIRIITFNMNIDNNEKNVNIINIMLASFHEMTID